MDDYRDIGASDFERYEKIRARISSVVEDFDLVTNSTPGTLQIDPVLVVYDLAKNSGAPPELTVETQSFKRRVIEAETTVPSGSGGTFTLVFPPVDGEIPFGPGNGRVERVTAAFLEFVPGLSATTGRVEFSAEVNDGFSTSPNGLPIARIGVNLAISGTDITEYLETANDISVPSTRITEPWSGVPGRSLLDRVVVGSNQNVSFTVTGSGFTDDDVDVNLRLLYEYRTE